ncbi:MAG: AAA family ATPase [Deltaproteobacteria bacterium]|nr:AAA family ATPase [Deltaproteobacteria bacterium]
MSARTSVPPPGRLSDPGRVSMPPHIERLPPVVVCLGGGGVGKTTTSAALAIALARRGERILLVTVDPARRLADALGVELGPHPARLADVRTQPGMVEAFMPDSRVAATGVLEAIWDDEGARARVRKNSAWAELADSIAGVHELFALILIARRAREVPYDRVVLDTAPSRQALDFLTYPTRLGNLMEGRAIEWLSQLAERAKSQEGSRRRPGVLAGARHYVESFVADAFGADAVRDAAELFREMWPRRSTVLAMARDASEMMGNRARFVLVAAPTGASIADLRYLARRLDKSGSRASAVLLNRADPPPGRGERRKALREKIESLPRDAGRDLATQAIDVFDREDEQRRRATAAAHDRLGEVGRGSSVVRLPALDAAASASDILEAIVPTLDAVLPHLRT